MRSLHVTLRITDRDSNDNCRNHIKSIDTIEAGFIFVYGDLLKMMSNQETREKIFHRIH